MSHFWIISSWEISKVILVKSHLIMNSINYSGSYKIYSILSTYIVTILVPSLFNMYNSQGYEFQLLDTILRAILLIYSLNRWCEAFTRLYTHLIRPNILSYLYYYPHESAIPSGIFVYISSSKVTYEISLNIYDSGVPLIY